MRDIIWRVVWQGRFLAVRKHTLGWSLNTLSGIVMPDNWGKTEVVVAIVGVAAAIVFGLIQFRDQIIPKREASVEIETIKWNVGDGRLGRGPYANVKLQISNSGSSPISVTRLSTSFALGSIETSSVDIDCRTADFTWMGVPWDELLRGPDYVEATSITVEPRSLVTEVVFFEPAALLSERDRADRPEFKIFVCLELDTIDTDMDRQETRIPLGWLVFDDDAIKGFTRSSGSEGGIRIFD